MSNTFPVPHFVRCPKCLKVLREPPDVSLYGCGGCGAILRGKAHSDSRETLSFASAASSSKNIFENERTDFGKQTVPDSDHSGDKVQVMKESPKVSGSSGEINKFEPSGNEIKNLADSKSNSGSLKVETKSQVDEQNGVRSLEENHSPTKSENILNEKRNKSSNQEISKANASLTSSDKVEESSEFHGHDTTSEDDEVNRCFLLRTSSSHVYDASVSSTDNAISRYTFQEREQDFSFASEDYHSALNFIGSGNGATSKSQSKIAKKIVKFRHTEKNDQVKILRKVDELRNELRVLFNRTDDGKGESRLKPTAQFERKVSPNQRLSLNLDHKATCSHNEGSASSRPHHIRNIPPLHQVNRTLKSNNKRLSEAKRHCRPVSGGAPFVICYRCYSLLQLPADFLVSTKRVHKLCCGSCSEILRYSFRPRTILTAWTPAEGRLPPSEDETNNNEILHDEIKAPDINYLREGDPVSYSEEYDPSFGRSNSYEAKPSIAQEEHGGGKRSSGSQLHRLMGYSSARHLLFETLSPVEGHRTEQDR